MDFLKALKRLETEFSGFQELMDCVVSSLDVPIQGVFFSGLDKYSGYSEFAENFVELGNGHENVLEGFDPGISEEDESEQITFVFDSEEEFRKAVIRAYRPFSLAYPGFEIQRVPAHQLGYGTLGRCFPYSGLIQIRNDLYGDEFTEVLTHELIHMRNPHLGELDVRAATRLNLPFTPRWH